MGRRAGGLASFRDPEGEVVWGATEGGGSSATIGTGDDCRRWRGLMGEGGGGSVAEKLSSALFFLFPRAPLLLLRRARGGVKRGGVGLAGNGG